MTICAVRGLVAVAEEMKSGSYRESRPRAPLPHEPKSNARFAVKLVRFDSGGAPRRDGFIGNYAECRHCGALYWEES